MFGKKIKASVMMLGWMKQTLILAGEEARGEGAPKVTLDHVLQVDSRL